MLERTAATFEACNLQRVLPRQARSTKTRRRLHTGFWQHGASALEICSLWPSPSRPRETLAEDAPSPQQPTALVASVFLLDFLYPRSTHSLLRRLYPGLPKSHRQDDSLKNLSRRRHMTSSAAVQETLSRAVGEQQAAAEHRAEDPSATSQNDLLASDIVVPDQGASTSVGSNDANVHPIFEGEDKNEERQPGTEENVTHTESQPASLDAIIQQASQDMISSEKRAQAKSAARLATLLSSDSTQDYYQLWDLYCQLDRDQQTSFRSQVILHFLKSSSIVEIGRAVTLFRQVPAAKWDNELLAAGVQLYLRSNNSSYAVSRLKIGFRHGLHGGLDDLLADAVSRQRWTAVIDVWLAFNASKASKDPSGNGHRKTPKLGRLSGLENLAEKYIAFEQHLAIEGVSIKHGDTTSRQALDILRQKLAKLALRQPCPPHQASVILKGLDDRRAFYEYLTHVIHRRKHKLWPVSLKLQLADVYKDFRQMPGAKPSTVILQGLFKILYPSDPTTVMLLYEDWQKTYGDLDKWAYPRFLAFFASVGDVAAVQTLWKRWVSRYPGRLNRSRGFYSIMNVYAQVGDVASAEKQLKVIKEEHRVRPDLDLMNTLLKCYVKGDDYAGALECFERIRESYRPDSFTMAHIMTISAKKGDLEKTLALFEQSQKEQIPVSKEMVLALVLVYCQNGKLEEAEKICIELAERNVTSNVIWNRLINFNGMHGKLHDCYRLLRQMKRYKLEWDQQTHEFLFQALVKVNQIQEAFNLIKRAQKTNLFIVNPEHYAILMVGAARLKDAPLVAALAAHMQRAGLTMNFNGHVAFMTAYLSKAPSGEDIESLTQGLTDLLQAMVPRRHADADHLEGDGPAIRSLSIGDPRVLAIQTQQLSRAIMLMVELGNYDAVEEMVDLYTAMFPSYRFAESLPPSVGSAIMLAYWKRNSQKRLSEFWKQLWDATIRRAQDANGKVYPAHEFDLNRPLHVMIYLYRKLNEGEILLACIQHVTESGFKLTGANWEMAIRYLAEMGQWEAAVHYCETVLMPMWSGWRRGKQSLEVRQSLRNARLIKPPSKAVILTLQKEWLEMQKLAAWSPEASAKLREFDTRYPKLHYAMLSAASRGMIASVKVTSKLEIYGAIKKMIAPYSTKELRMLRNLLMKRLYTDKAKKQHQKQSVLATRARLAGTGANKRAGSGRGRELALYNAIQKRITSEAEEASTSPEKQIKETDQSRPASEAKTTKLEPHLGKFIADHNNSSKGNIPHLKSGRTGRNLGALAERTDVKRDTVSFNNDSVTGVRKQRHK